MAGDMFIIRGGWLISGNNVRRDAAILIHGSRIEEVGKWPELAERHPGLRVYGCDRHLLMPGLINAHHHSGGLPQGLHGVEDDLLEPWLLSTLGMREEETYTAAALSAARLLKGGVTSVVDMTVMAGSGEEERAELERRLEAYTDAGIRASVAPGVIHRSFLVNGDGEDEQFLASLPPALRERVREEIPLSAAISEEEYLETISDAVRSLEAGSLQRIWFGPPGPQWASAGLMKRICEQAERLDTRIQSHALESFYEKLEGLRSHGKPTLQHLYDLGVLTARMTLAHGVWSTEEEIRMLAHSGTAVSHNPSSNLRLRAGTAPLNAMLEAGVTVGLGLDANGLNDDDDMCTELRMALRLHRTPQIEKPAPSHADVWSMATTGGAKLTGMEGELGKLEPGYRADVVLAETNRMFGPWHEDAADPLYLLVTRAKAEDVDSVWVDGRPVVRGGELLGVDEEHLTENIARHLRDQPPPQRLRALIEELTPHLRAWYSRWEEPPLEPYGNFNSRS